MTLTLVEKRAEKREQAMSSQFKGYLWSQTIANVMRTCQSLKDVGTSVGQMKLA